MYLIVKSAPGDKYGSHVKIRFNAPPSNARMLYPDVMST